MGFFNRRLDKSGHGPITTFELPPTSLDERYDWIDQDGNTVEEVFIPGSAVLGIVDPIREVNSGAIEGTEEIA